MFYKTHQKCFDRSHGLRHLSLGQNGGKNAGVLGVMGTKQLLWPKAKNVLCVQ